MRSKSRLTVLVVIIASLGLSSIAFAQNPRTLPEDTSPATADIMTIWKSTPIVTDHITLGTLKTFFTADSVPTSRTISCTAPLLCDGGASMTLAANRTLSMSAISLTTDATGSGTTSIPVTISAGAVTLAKMANMATASFLGRNTAGTGAPEVLSNATVSTMLRLPTFDVRAPAYGALCDNSTDDQTAIAAAITAAQATGIGGRILITGRCRHSGTLTITGNNVRIVGEGIGASQLITTSTTADQVVFNGTTGSDISNLSLVSSVTRTAGYSLRRIGGGYANDHNLFIAPTGGHGVFYDGAAGATKLQDSMIHIAGAFNGVTFSGGNDRWLSRLWIQGNSTSGSSCIVFTSTNGADLVENTECVLFGDYGIKIIPGNGESVLWTYFSNVYADQDNLGGWYIAPTGTGIVNGLTCVSCWAGTNGIATATTNGFTISGSGVDGANFYDIRSVNNGGHGVSIDGSAHVSLIGGYITGNSQQTINTKDGITINNVTGVRVLGVNVFSYGASRHRYSLAINGTSDHLQIIGNDFRGFATAAILNSPGLATTRLLTSNLPYTVSQDSYKLGSLQIAVATQFDKTSDTTLANVTGLTFNVEAGKKYGFRAHLFTTSNVAGGIKAAISGTATTTALLYEGELLNSNTVIPTRATTLGTAVCAETVAQSATCRITGTVTVNAAGTLTVQFAQNASNAAASSVLVGSQFYLEPIGN